MPKAKQKLKANRKQRSDAATATTYVPQHRDARTVTATSRGRRLCLRFHALAPWSLLWLMRRGIVEAFPWSLQPLTWTLCWTLFVHRRRRPAIAVAVVEALTRRLRPTTTTATTSKTVTTIEDTNEAAT